MTSEMKRGPLLKPAFLFRELRETQVALLRERLSPLQVGLIKQHIWLTRLTCVPPSLSDEPIEAIAIQTGGSSPKCVHEAAVYWKRADVKPVIILSGKIGVSKLVADKVGPGVNAAMLTTQLLEYGIPSETIITDDKSTHAGEQAQNVHSILKERNLERVLLVADTVALPRLYLTFLSENHVVDIYSRPVTLDRRHTVSLWDFGGFPNDWPLRISEVASIHAYSQWKSDGRLASGPTTPAELIGYLEVLLKDKERVLKHYRDLYYGENLRSYEETHAEAVARFSELRFR